MITTEKECAAKTKSWHYFPAFCAKKIWFLLWQDVELLGKVDKAMAWTTEPANVDNLSYSLFVALANFSAEI